MVTRLKVKDVPEPWFAQKKPKATMSRQKEILADCTNVEDSYAENVVGEPSRRGRRRSKAKTKVGDSSTRKEKAKSWSVAVANIVRGQSKPLVPDVEELRRKREEDAVACGRQVRSILQAPDGRRKPIAVTADASVVDLDEDATAAMAPGPRFSPPKSFPIPAWTEERNQVAKEAQGHVDEVDTFVEVNHFQRLGKEHVADEVPRTVHASKTVDPQVLIRGKEIDIVDDVDFKPVDRRVRYPNRRESPSPATTYQDDRSGGRESERTASLERGRTSEHPRFYEYYSGNPRGNRPRSSRRSISWSPEHSRGGSNEKRLGKLTEYYEENDIGDRYDDGYRQWTTHSSRERHHGRRYESPSPEKDPWQKTYPSQEYSRSLRRSWSPQSLSSPPTMSQTAIDGRGTQWRGFYAIKEEELAGSSAAVDRRQRRHEQDIREEEVSKRQKHGKKPFYLTLDPEGRPYGPGRPAWVDQINKLAVGLDPSCTHIRKQTFEDVQTFKDRLNESFDYSGTLNEDHLRGLMGKAVTKRRGELISVIKNNGKRHKHMDIEIWKRLEKLADSKQRQEKSEQGRYANSCRKTLGRTGPRGENGVREKLQTFLRRSPHPHEVEEEMQRDKGFGGRKKRKRALSTENDINIGEMMLYDEDQGLQSIEEDGYRLSSGTSYSLQDKRRAKDVQEKSTRSREYGVQGRDMSTPRHVVQQIRDPVAEAENLSKDDYIQSLEAEIQRLTAEKAKVSTSKNVLSSQSAMSTPYSSREGKKPVVQVIQYWRIGRLQNDEKSNLHRWQRQ